MFLSALFSFVLFFLIIHFPGVTADFVPPPILSPRTKSASGYCHPGQYPLADIVPPSPNLSPPQQLLLLLSIV